MTKVPKGNDFLPLVDKSEIKILYREEKNSLAKIRLQACLLRKEGNTLSYISSKVAYPLTTVDDWLRRINNEGLSRRYSVKQCGRPSRLSSVQKKELRILLEKSPQETGLPYTVWTTKLVLYYLSEEYNISYQIRQIEKLVHQLGFSIKKARPEHKKCNKALQESFKKKFKQKFNQEFMMDSRSFVLM